jgi:hypothetical protein
MHVRPAAACAANLFVDAAAPAPSPAVAGGGRDGGRGQAAAAFGVAARIAQVPLLPVGAGGGWATLSPVLALRGESAR